MLEKQEQLLVLVCMVSRVTLIYTAIAYLSEEVMVISKNTLDEFKSKRLAQKL